MMNAPARPTKEGDTSLDIQRQVVLPWGTSIRIAINSIRVRFLRSLITTLSLVLAVSFLCFVWVGNDVADDLLASGDPTYRQALALAGFDIDPQTQQTKSGGKQGWLVTLSLLVCVVGIINAQLMAVTERFREIGTMKCLGALDRFILRLFILEAGLQGFSGAAIGAISGAFAALLLAGLRFGTPVMALLNWPRVGFSMGMAVLVGCVLSLIGVLYPAWVAARMQPVEAMRTEH